MRYHTFDLTISVTGAEHEYALVAHSNTQGEATGRTRINTAAPPLSTLLQQPATSHQLSTFSPQQYGTLLYQSLFVDQIAPLLQRALGECLREDQIGLRIRLRSEPPELAALPWEYLYDPQRRLFLAASVETPVSRYLNLTEPVRKLACPAQINLLAAIPQNSGLDTEAEREMLTELSERLTGKIVVDILTDEATQKAMRAALRQKAYHIFHYAGHGSFKDDGAFIHLDHSEKLTEPMNANQFAQFFLDYPSMRLVFLNACHGATRSNHQALAGLAPQLVLRGVPTVIAMQDTIANDDAVLFATEFYAELCDPREGGQVEVAMSRARKALLQEKPESAVFGNPVLYLRAEEGRLWETQTTASPQPPAKEKKPLLERWQVWVGLIGGILAIVLGLLELREKIAPPAASTQEEAKPKEIATSYLRVFVIDATSGAPLADVRLTVTELPVDTVLTAMTTSDGGFHFKEIPAPVNSRARVYAEKEGYRGKNEYTFLPGPLKFELEKIK